jgi:ribosomal protein S6--L-glutamate ligase
VSTSQSTVFSPINTPQEIAQLIWITTPDNYDPEVQLRLQREGSERVNILRAHGIGVRVVHSCDVVPAWGDQPRLWLGEEDLLSTGAGFILVAWTWSPAIAEHLKAISRTIQAGNGVLLNDGLIDAERFGMDKLAMCHHAGNLGIPVLPMVTVPFGRYARRVLNVVRREFPGDSYLVKPREMAMGFGVVKADSFEQLTATVDLLSSSGLSCLVQPYYPDAHDVRVYVYRGKAIAALSREPANGSYLANVSQGGTGHTTELDSEVARMSEQLAQSLLSDYLCVDWLISPAGPVFNEWMTISAAFEDLTEPKKSEVAKAMTDYLKERLAVLDS